MFNELITLISEYTHDGFFDAAEKLIAYVSGTENFLELVSQIGTIPESIAHDSKEEKLFAKVSDAVLSRAFRELGLTSTVLSERSDSADVIAKSFIHGYTLVADAKAFRLSRTAKNQKDFKVGALSAWRQDNDYAVLCSPYFQYPNRQSQIYAQAIDNNVCLLSWEHLLFMLSHGVCESESLNLSVLWNFSEIHAHNVTVADKKKCFLDELNGLFLSIAGKPQAEFDRTLMTCVETISRRGEIEKAHWENERMGITELTREQAISELIKCKRIDEKINRIDAYMRGITHG